MGPKERGEQGAGGDTVEQSNTSSRLLKRQCTCIAKCCRGFNESHAVLLELTEDLNQSWKNAGPCGSAVSQQRAAQTPFLTLRV